MENILNSKELTCRSLSVQEINGRYSFYEDRYVMTLGSSPRTRTRHGFAVTENLKTVKGMDAVDRTIPLEWMCEGRGRIVGIDKDAYASLMNGEIHISDIAKWMTEDEYSPEKYVYVIWNSGAWQLADLDGNVIPYPIYFDYIYGGIDKGHYKLRKVIEYMYNDKRFMPVRFNGEDDFRVSEIPYYNADEENGGMAVEFLYTPTQDEAEQLKSMHGTDRGMFIREKLKDFKKEEEEI